jgi:hypothetical protein
MNPQTITPSNNSWLKNVFNKAIASQNRVENHVRLANHYATESAFAWKRGEMSDREFEVARRGYMMSETDLIAWYLENRARLGRDGLHSLSDDTIRRSLIEGISFDELDKMAELATIANAPVKSDWFDGEE